MTVKFTEAQVVEIVGTYVASRDAGDTYEERTTVVKELATKFKVTDNVIRGKLVAEDVYKKKEVAAKSAAKRIDKVALAKAIEAFCGGISLKSLTNMTAKDMQALWDRLVELSDVRNAEEGK